MAICLDPNVFTTPKIWYIAEDNTPFLQKIDHSVLSIILFHMVCSVMLNQIRQQVIIFSQKVT